MSEKSSWETYRPSKALWFWSCAGCVLATLILGFTWGGCVTGGTADEIAVNAKESGQAELAATVCVEKFMRESDAAVRLAQLKEQSPWQRDGFIEEGGWATLTGYEEPVDGATDLCAERLAEMELPEPNAEAAVESETAVN